MSITTILARAFALYFVIAGLSLLANRRFFKAVLKDLTQSHIAMMLIGFMTLILGITLISLHNLWGNIWEILVSGMCWLTFSAGVVRAVFPTFIMGVAPKMFSSDRYFYVAGVGSVIMGGVYGYVGYLL